MKKVVLIIIMLLWIYPMPVMAQRGCCSSHGGVVGCSSNGKQVCADGTLSPSCTCTPPIVYGCTDRKADNYNANANKDDGSCIYTVYGCMNAEAINYNAEANTPDGSCIFQRESIESISIPYEIEYTSDKNKVREGINGLKEITYQIQYDEQNKEIQKTFVSEQITIEPVSQIILQDAEEKLIEESEERETTNSLFFIFYVGLFACTLFLAKRRQERKCILQKVLATPQKYIWLILYFVLIIPAFIDIFLLILPKKT